MFYGTDRLDHGSPDAPDFSGDRGHALTLGSVYVSVPRAHTFGHVERPWQYSLFGITYSRTENPDQHFTIQTIEKLDRTAFAASLRSVVGSSKDFKHQALVFIHGYNVGFDAAAYRTAQIAYDLQFDGAPIFYSWPSRGSLEDYEYDQNSARQARPYLADFLKLVEAESGADVIHLIAHSMGNDPLMEVLAELNTARNGQKPLFNQIILAAPDIDVDVFDQLAKQVDGVAQGITLYASAEDRALLAAKIYARGIPRAGDVPTDGPVVVPGIDTIDITAVGSSLFSLNHSEYAENRLLAEDIGQLLQKGVHPPTARNSTLRLVNFSGGSYWRFPR